MTRRSGFREKYKSLIGTTLGKLTITGFTTKMMKKQMMTVFICKCECGNENTYLKGNLFRSKIPQCFSCSYKARNRLITNQKYKVGSLLPNGAFLKMREKIIGTGQTSFHFNCISCGKDMVKVNIYNKKSGFCDTCGFRWRRSGRLITFNGEEKNMADWARHFGISRERVRQLIEKYTTEDAFNYLHRKYILNKPYDRPRIPRPMCD